MAEVLALEHAAIHVSDIERYPSVSTRIFSVSTSSPTWSTRAGPSPSCARSRGPI